MAYRVPKDAKRGAGKMFVDKQAYLQWCNDEITQERKPTDEQYTWYDGETYVQRKILGKTQSTRKPSAGCKRWSVN